MRTTRCALAAGAGAALLLLAAATPPAAAQQPPPNPEVVIETSKGDITVELFRPEARVTVVNFLTYVLAGYYDGTIIHRVLRNQIIQGGGLNQDHTPRLEGLRGGILNEATNRLRNERGTIAMARLDTPNSARAQFFINVRNNPSFNHRDRSRNGFGYAVFGRVVDGMDVVDEIAGVRVQRVNGMRNVPRENIVIHTIRRLEP
ncbi:MAG: peptidylprolyl isomerase [Acidobacteria bacterium]|nr:peptidylprolyl isomerase [Acidobacteriota bacterium]